MNGVWLPVVSQTPFISFLFFVIHLIIANPKKPDNLSYNPLERCSIYERAKPMIRSPVALTAKQVEGSPTQDASAAFEAIFQEHWPRVHAVVYRLVGDSDEAEDLALEAFWRLYRRPPALDDQTGLRSWLYRVATNLGFNALRARKRRRQYEEEAGNRLLANDPSWDPAVEIERAQERQRVRAALARLKPRSAQLLVLRHSGLSYAELATALDVAPGSIGTLLARAEQEFEEQLKRVEGE
jgi:RNA polymerase sigma-70 factor (ECF subfamily)